MEALPPQSPEALAPQYPVAVAEYYGETPGLSTDGLTDPSDEVITVEAPLVTENPHQQHVELVATTPESTKLQRVRQKLGQVVMGESLGTAIDVATMAAGIPLPIREVAGSSIDSKVYGSPLDKFADAERNPSRLRKIGVRAGSIAVMAVTGMVAQKFGSEAVDMISDHFSQGVMGDYVTPLSTKLGGVMGMNSAVKRFVR